MNIAGHNLLQACYIAGYKIFFSDKSFNQAMQMIYAIENYIICTLYVASLPPKCMRDLIWCTGSIYHATGTQFLSNVIRYVDRFFLFILSFLLFLLTLVSFLPPPLLSISSSHANLLCFLLHLNFLLHVILLFRLLFLILPSFHSSSSSFSQYIHSSPSYSHSIPKMKKPCGWHWLSEYQANIPYYL